MEPHFAAALALQKSILWRCSVLACLIRLGRACAKFEQYKSMSFAICGCQPPAQSYQYKPLPSTSSFRVMKLLPGQWRDTISIELEFASWDTPPKYEAISYVWGNPNNTKSCLCNRKKFLITISLYEALVHFRDLKTPRYLWADAVW
jgi:hypothetical protein